MADYLPSLSVKLKVARGKLEKSAHENYNVARGNFQKSACETQMLPVANQPIKKFHRGKNKHCPPPGYVGARGLAPKNSPLRKRVSGWGKRDHKVRVFGG